MSDNKTNRSGISESKQSEYQLPNDILTKVDESQRITVTKDIKNMLRTAFEAFDTSRSGRLNRKH